MAFYSTKGYILQYKQPCAVMHGYAGFLSLYFLTLRRAEAFQKQKTAMDSAFYLHFISNKVEMHHSNKTFTHIQKKACESYFSPNYANCLRLFISRKNKLIVPLRGA